MRPHFLIAFFHLQDCPFPLMLPVFGPIIPVLHPSTPEPLVLKLDRPTPSSAATFETQILPTFFNPFLQLTRGATGDAYTKAVTGIHAQTAVPDGEVVAN
jgi:hypothetical protein